MRIHTTAVGPNGELVEFIKVEQEQSETHISYVGRLRSAPEGMKEFRSQFVEVTTDPTILLSGTDPLDNRKQLIVVNDSSGVIYIKPNNPPNLENGDYLMVLPGQNIIFTTEKEKPFELYGMTEFGTTKIRVMEVV